MIPDPYCLMTHGYQAMREHMEQEPLPPWHERLRAFWRGSTTGEDIVLNNRNQPSIPARSFGHVWPDRLDARINRIVQCRDERAHKEVENRLLQEGLMSATTNPWHAALHAWQIDIDGNVNSWRLLWKLLSGAVSCECKAQGSGITSASCPGALGASAGRSK